MKLYRLENFTKGWVVGDFLPSIIRTKDMEVGVKAYNQGDQEDKHYHRQAQEITIIVNGEYLMSGKRLVEGDIVFIEPNEAVDFKCEKSGYTVVIKTPSVMGDKFLGEAA